MAILVTALLAAVTAAVMGWAVAEHGNFREDGYILFRYIDHVATGHGFSFNPGGGPVEGATPFLWVLLVAAGVKLGMDVATTSIAWTSVGVGLCAAVFAWWSAQHLEGRRRHAASAMSAFASAWMVAVAGYGGFSTALFVGLFLLVLAVTRSPTSRTMWIVPPLGVVLGLFRPDGLVLAVGVWLLALRRAIAAKSLGPFVGSTLLAIAGGATYFAWRYTTFGELLPLPLIVKGHTEGRLGGIGYHLVWAVLWGWGPLIATWLALWRAARARRSMDALQDSLPGVLLFLALCLAAHSQNVGFRLQMPIFATMLWLVIAVGSCLSRGWWWAIWLLMLGFPAYKSHRMYAMSFTPSSVDALSARLATEWPDGATMAVSEAGRIPYWSGAHTIDLVGLNTAATAHSPLQPEQLAGWAPDLILVHGFPLRTDDVSVGVTPLQPDQIRGLLHPKHLPMFDTPPQTYDTGISNVNVASVVTLRFFASPDSGYDLMTLRRGSLVYALGIRRDGGLNVEDVRGWCAEALTAERSPSYRDLRSLSR